MLARCSHTSLRAQRSNPESCPGYISRLLRCARNDGVGTDSARPIRISNRGHTPHPRGMSCPSFAHLLTLFRTEGAGKTGCRLAPAVHCARKNKMHSGIQVEPETTRPSLRSGFTTYAALSSGSRALLPPSPCGSLERLPGWTTRTTTRLGASFGRQDDTVLPYASSVVVSRDAHRSRSPALRSPSRRRHSRPPPLTPRFVTIAIRPSVWDEVTRQYDKSEIL
jgi:hypothetical protein